MSDYRQMRPDSFIAVLQDMLDALIAGVLTNAGKTRAEIEIVVLREHANIIQGIILITIIQHQINSIQQKRDELFAYLKKIAETKKEEELNGDLSTYKKQLMRLDEEERIKLLKELEQLCKLLEEKIKLLMMQYETINKLIAINEKQIKSIDSHIHRLARELNILYKNHFSRLSKMQFDAVNLKIPDLLDLTLQFILIDPSDLFKKIEKDINLTSLNIESDIEKAINHYIRLQIINAISEQVKPGIEAEKLVEKIAAYPEYRQAINKIRSIIDKNIIAEDKTKLAQNKSDLINLYMEKNNKLREGEYLENMKMDALFKIDKQKDMLSIYNAMKASIANPININKNKEAYDTGNTTAMIKTLQKAGATALATPEQKNANTQLNSTPPAEAKKTVRSDPVTLEEFSKLFENKSQPDPKPTPMRKL